MIFFTFSYQTDQSNNFVISWLKRKISPIPEYENLSRLSHYGRLEFKEWSLVIKHSIPLSYYSIHLYVGRIISNYNTYLLILP